MDYFSIRRGTRALGVAAGTSALVLASASAVFSQPPARLRSAPLPGCYSRDDLRASMTLPCPGITDAGLLPPMGSRCFTPREVFELFARLDAAERGDAGVTCYTARGLRDRGETAIADALSLQEAAGRAWDRTYDRRVGTVPRRD